MMLGRRNEIIKMGMWTCSFCGVDTACSITQCRQCGALWPTYEVEVIKEKNNMGTRIQKEDEDVEMTDANEDLKNKEPVRLVTAA